MINLKYFFILSLISPVFFACQEEPLVSDKTVKKIQFLGTVADSEELETRAINIDNLTYQDYPTPIYVRMDVDEQNVLSGTYTVKSGYEGRLVAKDEGNELNWADKFLNHSFTAWTMPWKTDSELTAENYETVPFSPGRFKNLGLSDNEADNCSILEKFIGAKAGPVNYNENGEYVELRFYHLVSKVVISSMNLITNDGTSWQDVIGEMTIFDIPDRGLFYRHPSDYQLPFIAHPNTNSGLSDYENTNITFNVSKGASFYLCPEITFNENLKFKIKLTWPSQHGETGEYYGDFGAINIRRQISTADPDEIEWDQGKERNKLYAGEVLYLNLTLSQGNITGVTSYISNWDNKDVGTSNNYPHKGIYTSSQAEDIFKSGKSAKDLYDLYGETDDGESVFHLYDDINLDSSDIIGIEDPYILDGMGHTINVKELNDSQYSNVRDVYITDGTQTIYIDSAGQSHIIS